MHGGAVSALHQAAGPGILWGGRVVLIKRIENTVLIGIPLLGSILGLLHIVRHGLSWIDASAFLVFYALMGLGVALGMHRHFTHKSYEAAPLLRFLLGAFATMCFQGTILRWVIDHRRHHAHA